MTMPAIPFRQHKAGTVVGLALAFAAFAGAALAEHRLSGKVVNQGHGLSGVEVSLAGRHDVTEADGVFSFKGIEAGTYTLELSVGPYSHHQEVTLPWPAGEELLINVNWPLVYQETQKVYAVSKRAERLVEAPAAVTSLLPSELASQTSSGQVPRLLEFTPGVQLAQSDLYDYN